MGLALLQNPNVQLSAILKDDLEAETGPIALKPGPQQWRKVCLRRALPT